MREYLSFLQFYHPWALRVWFFGFGACVGSFLNVCILRIPAGRSIVTPRSQCSCGKPIAWYDNIPIFSWFILRGQARCCGAKFSLRYSIIEAVTAVVYLWLWMTYSPTSVATALAGMLFFALLLLGAMIDCDHLILPDVTTIGGLFAGLLFSFCWPQIHGLPDRNWNWPDARQGALLALAGVVAGAGVVYWIGEFGAFFLRRSAMGYGDMLLMGCVGAFCGWRGTLASIFGGAVLGCVVTIPLKLLFRKPSSKEAGNVVIEGEAAEAVEEKPSQLGRRTFVLDGWLVLAAMLGGMVGLCLTRVTSKSGQIGSGGFLVLHTQDFFGLGLAFLVVISVLAVWKRRRLALPELGLLLAIVVGVILSGIFPNMQSVVPSGVWLIDDMSGLIMSGVGAVVGAGIALWLLEFANIFRFYFYPASPTDFVADDDNQIWGEGYLLVFGALGAFCGWRTTVLAAITFAFAGALKGVWCYFAARSATRQNQSTEEGKTGSEMEAVSAPANADAPTFGVEIPFGPWLALAGFLYFAWPWLHRAIDSYLAICVQTFMTVPKA